jgi:hypothetical protein
MRYIKGDGYGSMLENIVNRFYPITGLMQSEETIRDTGVSYVGVAYVVENSFMRAFTTDRDKIELVERYRSARRRHDT